MAALPHTRSVSLAALRRDSRRGPLAWLLAAALAWAVWLHFAHTHEDAAQTAHDTRSICGLCLSVERAAPPPTPALLARQAPVSVVPAPPVAPQRAAINRDPPRVRGPPAFSA